MRILVAHNEYQEPGGEDQVFAAEVAMLRRRGHEVVTWVETNLEIAQETGINAAKRAVWSRASHRHVTSLIDQYQPDIAHFHNTFFRLSPSVFHACQQNNVPVVLTLHNYRLLCPTSTLYRDGHVCEACTGNLGYWPGIWHKCWHDSYARTSLVASVLTAHRWTGTWRHQIDKYIALTNFARQKYIAWGLAPEQVTVKPNFAHLDDPSSPTPEREPELYALFVGRMVAEKGVHTLLEAWRELPQIPLHVIGDGPLMDSLKQAVAREQLNQVQLFGRRPRAEVVRQMRAARFLVFPSTWYEGFPMTIVEAFSCGLPVIGSKIGSIAEIVEDGVNGLHFAPGDAQALAAKARWAWEEQAAMQAMGHNAATIFQEHYTESTNYQQLMAIYEQVLADRNANKQHSTA